MYKIGILGSTGYVGAELSRILSQHKKVELKFLDSRSYVDKKYSQVYPSLKKIVDNKCISADLNRDLEEIDLLFCALPHALSQMAVKNSLEKGKKVVDISADFRIKNPLAYEKWYNTKHEALDELSEAVYGLTEIYANEIKKARLVANPGCYPTSILLPLYPLLKEQMIISDLFIIDSKSGVSGAGRAATDTNVFGQCNENAKAYGIGSHRHIPEIEQELSIAAGKDIMVQFTPHLIPMTRGILSTIYIDNDKNLKDDDIRNILNDYYDNCKFIRILNEDEYPQTKAVYGSNYCDIGFKIDNRTNKIIIVSAIDNLVKGAAGQAIQNMNLMLGFDEREGLEQAPMWP